MIIDWKMSEADSNAVDGPVFGFAFYTEDPSSCPRLVHARNGFLNSIVSLKL